MQSLPNKVTAAAGWGMIFIKLFNVLENSNQP